MIPNNDSPIFRDAKYLLLEEGDVIKKTDEYYNCLTDQWLRIESDFIGNKLCHDESKPIRRKNTSYKSDK